MYVCGQIQVLAVVGKQPCGKISKMLSLNLILIFSFIFLSLQSYFTFGVCIRSFIYAHNYDIKST